MQWKKAPLLMRSFFCLETSDVHVLLFAAGNMWCYYFQYIYLYTPTELYHFFKEYILITQPLASINAYSCHLLQLKDSESKTMELIIQSFKDTLIILF